MKVFHSFEEIKDCPNAVVALGTFDGVHLGHKKVMQTAIDKARKISGTAVAVTFSGHPFSVICPQREPLRLSTIEQKVRFIANAGMDAVVLLPMNEALIAQSHADFSSRLLKYLQPRGIVVGENFTYGSRAAGNTKTLAHVFSEEQGIPVIVLKLLESPGKATPISSTVIRKAVDLGHMEMARMLLGRPYEIEGEIVHGDHRGHNIGFPTANMLIPEQMAVPPDGVYITRAEWAGKPYQAMTNIGKNPTFDHQTHRIETYIFNWDGDLYGQTMRLSFYKRLRHEAKFDTVQALISQMNIDKQQTMAYFTNFNCCNG